MFLSFDPKHKIAENETHLFFLNGPFSQWYPSNFQAQLHPADIVRKFNCAEQFMMAAKAQVFGDEDILNKIMMVEQARDWRDAPKKQKSLGRKVRGFQPDVWNNICRDVVFRANWAKFDQNENLGKFLDRKPHKILVEGAHYDCIWGVGLRWDDPSITNPENWLGTNWLGEALMQVRAKRAMLAAE